MVSHSREVTILMPNLVRTPDQHSALQPRTPGLKRSSHLSLLSSWNYRHAGGLCLSCLLFGGLDTDGFILAADPAPEVLSLHLVAVWKNRLCVSSHLDQNLYKFPEQQGTVAHASNPSILEA